MLIEEEKTAILEKSAADVRLRVEDALKQTIEREMLKPVIPMMGFSNVSHVVAAVLDPEQQVLGDEGLLSIGDVDKDEEKFRKFVERLTEFREPVSPSA
jgi:hypothetical protein